MLQALPAAQLFSKDANRQAVLFTGALLKVASRCNLDCDYCYVYKHADQSWRRQPHFMSEETVEQFSEQLRDYLTLHRLPEFSITFHGGEPLLFGIDRIEATIDTLIARLELKEVAVSLSLDGPKEINDRHRLDHGGSSTFDRVLENIRRLQSRDSAIFTGVIAVIDPNIPPRKLFEFFQTLNVPSLDLLLPDATYERPPVGLKVSPNSYIAWLEEALKLWFEEFSDLPVRWFDALIASRLGVASPTDAMGLGAVSLIVVDTDGSYTDHDVFKITAPEGPSLSCNVANVTLEELSRHTRLQEHSSRLTLSGLASECQTCPVVEACGGGSVMHRWHPNRGFSAPSVYCQELFGVMETATTVLKKSMSPESSVNGPKLSYFTDGQTFKRECERWSIETEKRAAAAATRMRIKQNGESPAALILAEMYGLGARVINEMLERSEKWMGRIKLQSGDQRLTRPFLNTIRVLASDSAQVRHGIATLPQVQDFFSIVNPVLPLAVSALISDIIFVESTIESSGHIFSFSDDTAPNVLYISPFVDDAPLPADDLGDSILHEFLHQVLYQMEREGVMLLDHVYPRFPAPWREGLRPSGGFLHGTFVFAGLSEYWRSLATNHPSVDQEKCRSNSERFRNQAIYGLQSLRQFALLTPRGENLLTSIANLIQWQESKMPAPGATLTLC
jgi:uncharacterized protein